MGVRDAEDPNWFPVERIVAVRGVAADLRTYVSYPDERDEDEDAELCGLVNRLIYIIWPACYPDYIDVTEGA